jgi:hypothetical protein
MAPEHNPGRLGSRGLSRHLDTGSMLATSPTVKSRRGSDVLSAPELLAVGGFSAVVIAAIAWHGDRRRFRRKHLDRVGIMPWTPIFFVAILFAIMLLGLAARAWLAG